MCSCTGKINAFDEYTLMIVEMNVDEKRIMLLFVIVKLIVLV